MTNIQVLLSLVAMILLSLVIITVSKNSLYTEDVMYNSNFGITATSLASSIIEDASKKGFDCVTDTMVLDPNNASDLNLLTDPDSLGTDTGEDPNNPKTFNDFDDYNNYATTDSSMPTAIFNVACKVNYVNESDLDGISNSRTYHKKITVKVWSKSMKDTVVMSSIYSYWNFLP
jgi:hypothetical protein